MGIKKKMLAAASSAAMLIAGNASAAGGISSFAEELPRFVVSNAEVNHGGTATVTVSIENNPGISAFKLLAEYDKSAVSLVSATGGTLTKDDISTDVFVGNTDKDPLIFSWFDGMNGDYTYNGIILTLTFEVPSDTAVGDYPVTLTYDPEDVFDENYKNVTFTAVSGKVTVAHSYAQKVIGPTCTENGCTIHTCTVCGHSFKDSETPSLGHSYTPEVTKKASCTEPGTMTYTCSRCKDQYTEEIKATGHSYVSQVIDPTDTEGGYTLHTCSECGDSYMDEFTDPIPAEYALRGKVTLVSTDPVDTAGLTVTAENDSGEKVSAVLLNDGSYIFKELPEGDLRLTAQLDLFAPAVQTCTLSEGFSGTDFTLYLYGDSDGSGTVDMKDLAAMQRKINDWDIEIIPIASDLNGDGDVSMKDLTMLQRYLNNWVIEFGK